MTIDTTYLDADTDNVKAARAAILAMAQAINAMNFTSPTFSGFVTMQHGLAVGVTFDNPTSGDTVSLTVGQRVYVSTGAGTKAALTFRLPASPVDGQVVRICTNGGVTSFTVADSAGVTGNVFNAPTTVTAGSFQEFVYHASAAKWYRYG